MGEIKRFEDLKVWQKSHELVLEVYEVTPLELSNLTTQTSNLSWAYKEVIPCQK